MLTPLPPAYCREVEFSVAGVPIPDSFQVMKEDALRRIPAHMSAKHGRLRRHAATDGHEEPHVAFEVSARHIPCLVMIYNDTMDGFCPHGHLILHSWPPGWRLVRQGNPCVPPRRNQSLIRSVRPASRPHYREQPLTRGQVHWLNPLDGLSVARKSGWGKTRDIAEGGSFPQHTI